MGNRTSQCNHNPTIAADCRPVLRLAFLGLALTLAVPASAEETSFRAGAWRGNAYFEGGYFSHCAISAQYAKGDTLSFGINRNGQLIVRIDNPDWALPVARTIDFVLQIDRRAPILRQVQPKSPQEVTSVFSAPDELFPQMEEGRQLSVTIGLKRESYSLSGTAAAIAALRQCWTRYG